MDHFTDHQWHQFVDYATNNPGVRKMFSFCYILFAGLISRQPYRVIYQVKTGPEGAALCILTILA